MKKRAAILIIGFLIAGPVSAAVYYIANNGSDAAATSSQSAPWATIAKAATAARSGDQVLLRRGDVFRESVDFGVSGITIGDYGTASAKPVVSGSAAITGWAKQTGTSIWIAATAQPLRYLFVNNQLQTIARYPNRGWLRLSTGAASADGNSTILTPQAGLTAHTPNTTDYWKGANVRWRRWSWWYETRPVTAYNAGTGALTVTGKFQPQGWEPAGIAGWGFYLDNKLSELDTMGEWFFDAAAGKVYLWPAGNADPASLTVEGSWRDHGLSVSGGVVQNIIFRQFANTGLSITGQATVQNCRFENIGSDSGGAALTGSWNAKGADVNHNAFENCFNLAISWNQNNATTDTSRISYDTFTNIGAVPGYGGAGSWHAAGIVIPNGKNIAVRYCRFDSIGYAGIIFGHDSCLAEYNVFNKAMATLNDGGAIYCNCSYNTIRHNIILNTEGDLESSGPWSNLGHALWPEFLTDFHDNLIEYNTCANSGGFGLFLPNNFHATIRNNVFYNNHRAQMELEGMQTNSSTGRTQNLPQNHTITCNVMYSTADSQFTILYRPDYDYGTLSGNYYCNALTDTLIGQWQANDGWSTYHRTIAWWQQNYTHADATAKTDIIKRPKGTPAANLIGTSRLVINDAAVRQAMPLDNGIYKDLDGNTMSGTVTLDGYSSIVLVHTGQTLAVANALSKHSLLSTFHPVRGPDGQIGFVFGAKNRCTIKLAVFDLHGRQVGAAFESEFPAGTNHVMVQKRIGAGNYLYRLTMDGKMVEQGKIALAGW
jgi:hypothetical protein